MLGLGGGPEQVPVQGRQGQVHYLLVALVLLMNSLLTGGPHSEGDAVQQDGDLLLEGAALLVF